MSKLKMNFIYQSAYELLIILLPLVTSPYISRVLGAEKIGIYSYTYSIANYFVLFAMLGIKNYGNRMIAKSRDNREDLNRTFSSIFCLHALISVFVIFAYIFYALFIVKENRLYVFIQGTYVLGALFDINWFYFGIEKFKLTVTRNTVIKILTVVLIFTFVKSKNDLWIYVTIMALGSFISQSIVWFFLRRYVSFVKPTWKEVEIHLKPMAVLFIPAIAVSLYKVMDKIMLGSLATKTQVGFYENSEKIINIPMTIITAFGTVMLPRMSNMIAKGDNKETQKYIKISMKYIMFIAFALGFGIASISHEFVPVFFGDEFLVCGPLITVLAITVPFIAFANIIRTQYLIPSCEDKIYIVSVFTGAIVNVIINLLLISRLQAMGTVIGTVFAEISVCVVQAFYVRKKLPIVSYIRSFILFTIPGGIMYLVVRMIGNYMGASILTLIVEVVVGGVTYLLLGALYLLITKDEIIMSTTKKIKKRMLLQR